MSDQPVVSTPSAPDGATADKPVAPVAPAAPARQRTSSDPAHRRAPDAPISIDQFMAVELRVAKVLAADRVPKSKKLIEAARGRRHRERTIVAGIAEAYEPETLVGRKIVIVPTSRPPS